VTLDSEAAGHTAPVLANGAVRRGLPPRSKLLLSSDRRAILLWSKQTTFALWRKDSSSASIHQLQSKQTLKLTIFLQQQVASFASFVLREVAQGEPPTPKRTVVVYTLAFEKSLLEGLSVLHHFCLAR
jgi:hypothetical protein